MSDFGKMVYGEVERIVLLSSVRPINSQFSKGNIRIGTAYGRIDENFYTLVHNFGENLISSRKYVQILENNGKDSYTIWDDGRSDRNLPSNLIDVLRKFKHIG